MDITERKYAEEALANSEQRYRAFFENTSIGYYRTDSDGKVILANPAYLRCTGFDSLEDIAKRRNSHRGYSNPSSATEFLRIMETEGRIQGFEAPWLKRDGTEIWIRESAYAEKGENGEIIFIEGTFEDVTERKSAEEALRKSEEKYRNIFENAIMGIFQSTPDGKYLNVNPALAKIYGFESPDELIKNIKSIEDDIYFDSSQRNRFREVLEQHGEVRDFISRYKHKTKGSIWMSVNAKAIKDAEGRVIYYEGTARDITLRKMAEDALIRERDRAQQYLDTAGVIMLALDKYGNITMINKKGCEVLGWNEDELIGKNWMETCIPGELRTEINDVFNSFSQQKMGDFEYVENMIVTKNGESRLIAWYNRIIHNEDGEPTGTLSSGNDITESRRIEQAHIDAENKFRLLFDNMGDGVAVYEPVLNGENFIFVDINRTGAISSKVDKSEIIGKYVSDVFPGIVEMGLFDAFKRVNKNGKPELYPLTHYKDNRIEQWVENYIFKLPTGFIVAMYRDTTDRMQALEALENKHSELDQIFDASPDALIYTTTCRTIQKVNEAFTSIFGYDAEEVRGKSIRMIYLSDKEYEAHAETIYNLDPVLSHPASEIEYKRKDGSSFISESIGTLVSDPKENISGVLIIARDISEKKKAERDILESRERIRNLLAHINAVREAERTAIAREIHDELGAMLAAFKMDISWLNYKLEDSNPDVNKKLSSMKTLVDTTVRTVSRISSKLRPGMLDDLGLIAAVEWQIEEFSERTGIDCEFKRKGDLDFNDDRGATAVFRILQETLSNVMRHSKATSVRIRLEEKDNTIILRVIDNGIGITADNLNDPRSFGLIGMQERARFLGGSVEINQVKKQGTEIIAVIPVKENSRDD